MCLCIYIYTYIHMKDLYMGGYIYIHICAIVKPAAISRVQGVLSYRSYRRFTRSEGMNIGIWSTIYDDFRRVSQNNPYTILHKDLLKLRLESL